MDTDRFTSDQVRLLLKKKKIHLSEEELSEKLQLIHHSQDLFPQPRQQSTLIQLLHQYEHSKHKVIIQFDEMEEKKIPAVIQLSVLAEDWRGMANSIVGIIHQKEGNVLFLKAITIPLVEQTVAVIILVFMLETIEEYNRFLAEKNTLTALIREASLGSQSKTLLLEDETVKFELYNQTVNRIKKKYKKPDIDNIIGETGEALKFFSSRSREYLEERKVSDLAEIILDNYRFQKSLELKETDKKIKIKNFETPYEKLTGITFACWKDLFSIENFLKTLEFIVPNHIIKHHKSFINQSGVLVYRIEIVDSEDHPLALPVIKTIESSLNKQIGATSHHFFTQVKAIGGFEHYARAIIPFLMDELQQTGMTQVFMNVDKKSEFILDMKLLIVHFLTRKHNLNQLIWKLERQKGVEIYSVIPPRIYKNCIEVNILNLKITISEFASIAAIFFEIKRLLKQVFKQIRDFDEGLRERDLQNLMALKDSLSEISPPFLKEIYYNFDEIYRIESLVPVLSEIIQLCHDTVRVTDLTPNLPLLVNHKNILDPLQNRFTKTVIVISTLKPRKVLSSIIGFFKEAQVYFSRFEWKHRIYLVLTLKKGNLCLSDEELHRILTYIATRYKRSKIIGDDHFIQNPEH